MPSNWQKLQLTALVPTELRSISDTVSAVTSGLTDFLNLNKTALELSKQFASAASSNPIEDVISSSVSEIEGFIDALTQNTVVYAIHVPIQKKFFGAGQRIPVTQLIDSDKSPTFDQLTASDAVPPTTIASFTREVVQFINAASTAQGGNQGFWKALSTSLQDPGDISKPDFPSNYAVAGVCVLFGATSLEALQPNFNLFSQLMNAGPRASLSARTRPTIKNVRVKALPTASGRIGVQIDWDPILPINNFGLYSAELITVSEIVVVRSINPKFRQQFSWSENFSSELSDDLSDMPSEDGTKVIARIRNDGVVARYIDQGDGLEIGKSYYYGVTVRYEMDGKSQPVSNFSAVRRAIYTGQPQTSAKGEPPDWWSSPNLIMLFPPLAGLINQVRLAIAGLASRSASNSSAQSIIDQTIKQIASLIQQGERVVSELASVTRKLDGLLGNGAAAATASTVITTSSGGMDGWLAELAKRLADTTDESRPAFDADELVAGIVIVAGAPNLPALTDFISLITTLFGASADNPIISAVNAVDAAVAATERVAFDEGLQPERRSDMASTDTGPALFDESMQLTDTVEC